MRYMGIGSFHHEVELLTAKHNKDLACADLQFTKKPEDFFQDSFSFQYAAERARERVAVLKRLGLYTTAAYVGLKGLSGLFSKQKKPISRRGFLKDVGLTTVGLSVGAAIPEMTKVSRTPIENLRGDITKQKLRDPFL
ncbi:twin-arginine translocation signal domain-containing protein, partial [Patescibacteria group bacterium]|nr:twin-arginine translocation signal domain-containing protein [Patescibacteria group bacterium]